MLLDLGKDISEGVWFEYDEDVSFKIRHTSPEFVRKSRVPHLRNRPGKGETLTKQTEKEWDKDLWDHIIEDWKGVVDSEKKPLPCTIKNKIRLIDATQIHQTFCFDIATNISNFMDKEKLEEEEKN